MEESEEYEESAVRLRKRHRVIFPYLKDDSDESYQSSMDESSDDTSIASSTTTTTNNKHQTLQNNYFHLNPKVIRYVCGLTRSQARRTMSRVVQSEQQRRNSLLTYEQHTENILSDLRLRLASNSRVSALQYVPLTLTCSCSEDRPANHFPLDECCLAHNQRDVATKRAHVAHLEEQLQEAKSTLQHLEMQKSQLEQEVYVDTRQQMHPLLRSALLLVEPNNDTLESVSNPSATAPPSLEIMVTAERIPKSFMNNVLKAVKSPYEP
mmetsp:Transcript_3169/g.4732  ORF Transcript_3169/g.4732 Transcript_3169/m.4732 type:complete len:266 (-) Transcript_3169:124-921(-)